MNTERRASNGQRKKSVESTTRLKADRVEADQPTLIATTVGISD